MERIENLLEKSLAAGKITGTEEGMQMYSSGSCDRCDCVCNQPCHGEGTCYKL